MDEEARLRNAITGSFSVAAALKKLGLVVAGGNYGSFYSRTKKYNIDISHFTGQGWNIGNKYGPKRELSAYLSNEYSISSHSLRLRLLKEGIKQHKCESCGRVKWLGKLIPLELNHVDGNHYNNNLSNLEILCPNCHAQTPTYRGRNKRRIGGIARHAELKPLCQ